MDLRAMQDTTPEQRQRPNDKWLLHGLRLRFVPSEGPSYRMTTYWP